MMLPEYIRDMGGVAKAIEHDRYLIPEEMNVNSGVTFVR